MMHEMLQDDWSEYSGDFSDFPEWLNERVSYSEETYGKVLHYN